jgi:hypothetical protein
MRDLIQSTLKMNLCQNKTKLAKPITQRNISIVQAKRNSIHIKIEMKNNHGNKHRLNHLINLLTLTKLDLSTRKIKRLSLNSEDNFLNQNLALHILKVKNQTIE